ncbi:SAE2-domain-containing protein [Zymoseptoria brevis]|uniref:SAE2-domain-containing protein n=1 Tax=Zymoseptoria brevis TaxID=1047168 RepID=A0A0F4GG44_9PEZI|nr:SAE2-domain-containing protein [Zymoseptoria brevis]
MDNRSPQREPTLEQALNSLGRKTYRVEQLEAENAALRAQLAAQTTPAPPDQNSSSTQTTENAGVPVPRWNDLVKSYTELQARCGKLESRNSYCEQKYRESKKWVRDWKIYLDSKQELPKQPLVENTADVQAPADESRPDDAPGDTERTPRAEVTKDCTTTNDTTIGNESTTDDGTELPSSPPINGMLPERMTSQTAVHLPLASHSRVTSSQTTVDDGVEDAQQVTSVLTVKAEPSSDGPIVISTRCLKRKFDSRESPRRRIKRDPQSSPGGSIHISQEPERPQGTPAHSMHPETSDLDALGAPITTPRRPRRVSALRQRATSEEVTRHVPILRRQASSLSEGDADQQSGDDSLPSIKSHRQVQTSTINVQSRGSGDVESRVLQHPNAEALRPISGNVARLQPVNDASAGGKPGTTRRRADRNKHLLFSEDGEDKSSQQPAKQKDKAFTPPAEVRQRLEDLLNNGPSPKQNTPLQLPPRQDRLIRQRPHLPAQLITPASTVKKLSPVKKISPVKKVPPMKRTSPAKRASPVKRAERLRAPQDSPPPVRPEDEPLRIRPMETLGLSDFRINPAYMGTTFAFADPIRGKAQRRALPVCNQPGCSCSSLRTTIRMGGTALSGKSDAAALETYFGEDWMRIIGGYNAVDRKEILIQAHAHCFANAHGKHRQAFERRATPPGYWRTEFPTTQEQRGDHEEADQRERKAVEERYREAMRTGGRWKFRDE